MIGRFAFPVVFAVTACVAIFVGLAGLEGGKVRDDLDYVDGNPHVACAIDPVTAFLSPFQPLKRLGLWRPTTTLSLALDYGVAERMGGPDAVVPFHATNVLLAAMAAVLTVALARAFGAPSAFALVAGLLVAVHPVRTEAVHWISGRAENLMTVGALATLLLATRRPTLVRDAALFVVAFLACASKEQAFVLPVLAVWIPHDGMKERLRTIVVVGAGAAAAFTLRWTVMGAPGVDAGLSVLQGTTFVDRLPYAAAFLGEYARLLVWPSPLLAEYDEPRTAPGILAVCVGILAAAALVTLAVRGIRGGAPGRLAAFGAALVVLPLLPILNLAVPTGEHFAERFLALPACGCALLAVGLAARAPASYRVHLAGLALVAIVAGAWTFRGRAADWASPKAVIDAVRRTAPNGASAPFLESAEALGPSDPDTPRDEVRGRSLLLDTLARDPAHVGALTALGLLDARDAEARGDAARLAAARARLEAAHRIAPRAEQIRGAIGLVAKAQGDLATAEMRLLEEHRSMPAHLSWALPLAELRRSRGDALGAADVERTTIAAMHAQWTLAHGFVPVAEAYVWALAEPLGRPADAVAVWETAAKAATPRNRARLDALRTSLIARGAWPKS